MSIVRITIAILAALLLSSCQGAGRIDRHRQSLIERLPRGPEWHLRKVVDAQTLTLRSDEGETRTIKLACIGLGAENRAVLAYIKERLQHQEVGFWALETAQTNWYARPMCLFLDVGMPRGGELVWDYPTLNEELLAWGYAPFVDVEVVKDPYNLKARLNQAKEEWDRRLKERAERRRNSGLH